jgi:hypothetical protein
VPRPPTTSDSSIIRLRESSLNQEISKWLPGSTSPGALRDKHGEAKCLDTNIAIVRLSNHIFTSCNIIIIIQPTPYSNRLRNIPGVSDRHRRRLQRIPPRCPS